MIAQQCVRGGVGGRSRCECWLETCWLETRLAAASARAEGSALGLAGADGEQVGLAKGSSRWPSELRLPRMKHFKRQWEQPSARRWRVRLSSRGQHWPLNEVRQRSETRKLFMAGVTGSGWLSRVGIATAGGRKRKESGERESVKAHLISVNDPV